MSLLSSRQPMEQRPGTASIYRHIMSPGELADSPSIPLGVREWQIARDCDYPQNLQFLARRQRKQNRNGVVKAGIGIYYDPALHR